MKLHRMELAKDGDKLLRCKDCGLRRDWPQLSVWGDPCPPRTKELNEENLMNALKDIHDNYAANKRAIIALNETIQEHQTALTLALEERAWRERGCRAYEAMTQGY